MSDAFDDPDQVPAASDLAEVPQAPGAALASAATAATEEAEGRAPDTVEGRRSEGLRRERVVASKQYRDGTFHNTSGVSESLRPEAADGQRRGTGWMLREWMFGGQERRPKVVLPVERPHEAWTRP
ncbi:MAG TPA: hypothetical protein VMZ53_02185, partial [Kofleriaceae bacterium]|nr:hypothetical protein [Kofleriaceae bacterium]